MDSGIDFFAKHKCSVALKGWQSTELFFPIANQLTEICSKNIMRTFHLIILSVWMLLLNVIWTSSSETNRPNAVKVGSWLVFGRELLCHNWLLLYVSQFCHISVFDVCVVYLLCENMFLGLERVPVLESFVTAGLGVTSILQRPSFLFQTDHLVFAHSTQMSVQLSHWQTYQLLIRKTLIHPTLKEKETKRDESQRFVTEWTQRAIMIIKASSKQKQSIHDGGEMNSTQHLNCTVWWKQHSHIEVWFI